MAEKEYKIEIAELREKMKLTLAPLEKQEAKIQENFESEVNASLSEKDKKKMGRPFQISDLDAWDCPKSPFGYCVINYKTNYEPCCVFCGEPEERQ